MARESASGGGVGMSWPRVSFSESFEEENGSCAAAARLRADRMSSFLPRLAITHDCIDAEFCQASRRVSFSS